MAAAIDKYIAEIRNSKLLAKHAGKILELVRPHIHFTPRKGKVADGKSGASRFGGEPDLPVGTPWPIGPGYDGDEAMDFIAQVDLADVARRDVDKLLPKTGLLAFFVSRDYSDCKVIHADGEVERVADPRRKKKSKPPKHGGFDVSADMVLPPPWTEFVSSKNRSKRAWNARTGKTGKGKTLVELSAAAHDEYEALYERWLEEVGWSQTGMLGYERMMEGVQERDELCLLRVDYSDHIPYDFVELVSIYWLISKDALEAERFDKIDVFCGSTI
jgi:uncharacterized protein YwqG